MILESMNYMVSHVTVFNWMIKFAQQLSKQKRQMSFSNIWHVDEKFVRVRGCKEFAYLWVVIDDKNNIIAMGEVGMDFHWADKEKTGQEQADIFRKIVKFAVKLGKPLVVHSWEAEEECLNILEEEIKNKEIPVIQHCFGGRKSMGINE